MNNIISKTSRILILGALVCSVTVFAGEVEEDDAEESIEKAEKQVERLGDPKGKYKDAVIFAEIAPILKHIKKSKIPKRRWKLP